MITIRFTLAMLLTIISFGLFTSCDSTDDINDDGTIINYNDLPKKSQSFIEDNFTNFNVQSTRKTRITYDVFLSKNVTKSTSAFASAYEIKFDFSGVWLEIEAKNDGALPDNVLALIPRSIVSYVTQNYPTGNINEIDKVNNGYKIDLTGETDVELLFDANGTYLGIDNHNVDHTINISDLPEVSKIFLETHFSGIGIAKVTKDKNSYDVKLVNNTELEFILLGEWSGIDAHNNILPISVLKLLPQGIIQYLTTKYPSNRIKDISKTTSSYKIELISGIELTFDSQGNLWGASDDNKMDGQRVIFDDLPESAKNIIKQHFLSQATVLYVDTDSDEYEVKLSDGTDVQFDLLGNLKSVEVLSSKKVPDALIPGKIRTYLSGNYANKNIVELEVKVAGYQVKLSGYPEIELLFDLNGNFISIDN